MQVLGMQADLCPHRSDSGRHRPKLAEYGPILAEMGPTSAEVGPNVPEVGTHSACICKFGPWVDNCRAAVDQTWPMLAKVGQILTDVG